MVFLFLNNYRAYKRFNAAILAGPGTIYATTESADYYNYADTNFSDEVVTPEKFDSLYQAEVRKNEDLTRERIEELTEGLDESLFEGDVNLNKKGK